eukprot:484797_1
MENVCRSKLLQCQLMSWFIIIIGLCYLISTGNIPMLQTMQLQSISTKNVSYASATNETHKFDFCFTIPSVKRPTDAFYLPTTIRGLMENINLSNEFKILFNIYCSEINDSNWCFNAKQNISKYFDYTNNTNLSFIIANPSHYPSFEHLIGKSPET